tara:strand:+ start:831 stop:1952 length:1122 start_codon:yes stop_codon:yes gene_type:complete
MSKARELAELGAVYDSGALSNRNLIINGGMQVWQRATAATAVTNSTYGTVDRFRFWEDTDGAYTVERSTDVPSGQGFGYSTKLVVTTADTSLAGGQYAQFAQRIEAQNLQQLSYGTSGAKTITVSFWVKSSKTGSYAFNLYKNAAGNTAYLYYKSFSIDAANTWEKKIITISPTAGSTSFITSSAGALDPSTSTGFEVYITLAIGSSYHGATDDSWSSNTNEYSTSSNVNWLDSTSNNFYITGLQMEVGTEATPFEHRSYADELKQCQRYYWQIAGQNTLFGHGFYYGTTEFDCRVNFPVEMRASPSMTSSNNTNDFGIHQGGDYFPSFSGIQYYNGEGLNMYVTSNVSGTNGEAKYCAGNQSTAKVQFSAEL